MRPKDSEASSESKRQVERHAAAPTLLALDCMHLSPLGGPRAAPQPQVAIVVLGLEHREIQYNTVFLSKIKNNTVAVRGRVGPAIAAIHKHETIIVMLLLL